MKPLNINNFATTTIQDLGMLQLENTKRKMRYVELSCKHCASGFVLTADNAKRRQEDSCSICKIWYEDTTLVRKPIHAIDTKTASFKCDCCDNLVVYTKQGIKSVQEVLCHNCRRPLKITKQSEMTFADILETLEFKENVLIVKNTQRKLHIGLDGRCSIGGVKFAAARAAYMLQYLVDIKKSIVYFVTEDSQNICKSNLTLEYKKSIGYANIMASTTQLYSVKDMLAKVSICSSRFEFKEKFPGMYAYAVKNKLLGVIFQNLPSQHIKWTDDKAMHIASAYNTRECLKRGNSKAYDYVQKRSGDSSKFYTHMLWNSPSENNVIYFWKVVGLENVYKIGVTSGRLGHKRVESVAKESGLEYEIILISRVTCKATDLEKILLAQGMQYKFDTVFSGCTEFRILTNTEVQNVIKQIKDNIDETKL